MRKGVRVPSVDKLQHRTLTVLKGAKKQSVYFLFSLQAAEQNAATLGPKYRLSRTLCMCGITLLLGLAFVVFPSVS